MTLADVLARAAATAPDQGVVHVGENERFVGYADLHAEALRVAGGLRAAGLAPGDLLLVVADDSADFLALFWGAVLAGVVPVPLPPEPDRLAAVRRLLGEPALAGDDVLPGARRLTAATLRASAPLSAPHRAAPDDLAFLQFSSGSTGTPKGVELTHRNVTANLEQAARAAAIGPGDVIMTWMPYFHDMGLIGTHLTPVHVRCRQVRISPLAFAKRPEMWLRVAAEHRATVLSAANFALAMVVRRVPDAILDTLDLSSVRLIMVGAEPISPAVWRAFTAKLARARLSPRSPQPVYGLAEATVAVCFPPFDAEAVPVAVSRAALARGVAAPAGPGAAAVEFMDVGHPVPGCAIRIVDDEDQPLEDNLVGHVQVSGPNVTRGYHRDPAATAAALTGGWLRTGDLGFLRAGRLVVTGRHKDVVFVHGRTFHAADLEEVAAATPGLGAGPVAVVGTAGETREVVVVFVAAPAVRHDPAVAERVRRRVAEALGYDEVRVEVVPRGAFARTTSGKLRRQSLRARIPSSAPDQPSPAPAALRPPASAPVTRAGMEDLVRTVWARVLRIEPAAIGPDDRFLAVGGSSLAAMEVLAELEDALGRNLDPVLLRDCATIPALADRLLTLPTAPTPPANPPAADLEEPALTDSAHRTPAPADSAPGASAPADPAPGASAPADPAPGDLAIIGMACRFPGVDTPEQFWDNLVNGRDSVATSPSLDDPSLFDAEYFGIGDDEARHLDPHARIFLELAHEALERAGYAGPRRHAHRIGVFAAVGESGYPELLRDTAATGPHRLTGPHALTGSLRNLTAARVAHLLDLHGPAIAVDTACSSALVALHLARLSLNAGDCDIAVVGGVNLNLTDTAHQLLTGAQALSPTGRCRAFADDADGFVAGEGGAAIVLTRPGADPALALLKATAVNNDGRSLSLMAPNPLRQREVMAGLYRSAGIDAADVTYVEAHGTGTPVGDPIEARSLAYAFPPRPGGHPRLLGSVKTNIGHLLNAAAMPALLKVILAFQHRELPPSLHHGTPSRRFDLAAAGFEVLTERRPWHGPLAAVNSFGFGGTNAHAVLAAPPHRDTPAPLAPAPAPLAPAPLAPAPAPAASAPSTPVAAPHRTGPHLLTLSARSEKALLAAAADLAAHLRAHPALPERDVCGTASTARDDAPHRLAIVADGDLAAKLSSLLTPEPAALAITEPADLLTPEPATTRPATTGPAIIKSAVAGLAPRIGRTPRVVFLFDAGDTHAARPGEGAQLYASAPAFRTALDEMSAAAGPVAGRTLTSWCTDPDISPAELSHAEVARPLSIALGLARAAQLRAFGVRPDAITGTALARLAAAALAGELTPAEAVRRAATPTAPASEADAFRHAATPTAPADEPAPAAAARRATTPDAAERAAHPAGIPFLADPDEHDILVALDHSPLPQPADPHTTLTDAKPQASHAAGNPQTSHAADNPQASPSAGEPQASHSADNPQASHSADNPQASHSAGNPRTVLAAGDDARELLVTAGELWQRGARLDRAELDAGVRRVPLPTYPFQRRRFWVRPPVTFSTPHWSPAPLTASDPIGDLSVLTGPFTAMTAPVNGHLLVITKDAFATGSGGEHHDPDQAVRVGLAMAWADENPGLGVRIIDLSSADSPEARRAAIDEEATAPPLPGPAETVAWRGGRRLQRTFVPATENPIKNPSESMIENPVGSPAPAPAPAPSLAPARNASEQPALPPDGSYLIVGGAGAAGSAVARDLARRGRPRLLLTGRSAAPSGLLAELRALGATAEYRVADVSREADVAALVAGRTFDVVVQAAGVVRPGSLRAKTAGEIDAGIAAKVAGTRLLATALADQRPLFVALSSVSSVLPGLAGAVGDYVAGNAFLDAFAAAERAAGRRFVAVNLPALTGGGLATAISGSRPALPGGGPATATSGNRPALPGTGPATATSGNRPDLPGTGPASPNSGSLPVADVPDLLWQAVALGAAQVLISTPATGAATARPGPALTAPGRGAGTTPHRAAAHTVTVAPAPAAPGTTPASGATPAPEAAPAPGAAPRSYDEMMALLRDLLAGPLDRDAATIGPDEQFLALGLDSLTAVDLVKELENRLGRSLSTTLFFEHRTPGELARHLAGPGVFPLSPVQRAFHTAARLYPEVPAYAYVRQRVTGPIEPDRLRGAFVALEQRHPMLRVRIGADGQRFEPAGDASWFRVVDLDGPVETFDAGLRNRTFDLEREAPIRAVLAVAGPDLAYLLVVAHHAAADGYSLAVLGDELWGLYAGSAPAPPPVATFADHEALRAAPDPADLDHWRTALAAYPDLPLPFDGDAGPRPPYAVRQVSADPELTARLTENARAAGVTVFHLLLAVYVRCLSRWSGRSTVPVLVARAGRTARLAGIDRMVGPFADTLPLLTSADPDEPVTALADRLREAWLVSEQHGSVSTVDLARLLAAGPEGPRTAGPASFSFARFPSAGVTAADQVAETVAGTASAATRLGLVCFEAQGALHFSWNYPAGLFTDTTITRFATEHLAELHHAAAPIPIGERAERAARAAHAAHAEQAAHAERAAHAGPAGRPGADHAATDVVARIRAQCHRSPAAVAVLTEGVPLSYLDLDLASDRLAAQLAGSGARRIGLLTGRGAETVIGLLGILKAGAAWVPLDAAHPPARLADQLTRAGAGVVVCDASTRTAARALGGFPLVDTRSAPLGTPPPVTTGPDDLAYVIFTSGSTGRPKGVPITHRSMVNYLDWAIAEFGYGPGDRLAQTASICFDASVRQLLAPLLTGATVVAWGNDTVRDPDTLLDRLRTDRITVWSSVPTLWERLLTTAERRAERPDLPELRWVHVGGEELSPGHVRRWFDLFGPAQRITNLYGPTETTINATCHVITARPADDVLRLPIGRPVGGTEVAVVGPDGRPCATDEVGELHVGGIGLTRGYLDDPDQTAAAFSWRDGRRWYRTGDRATMDADGLLWFRGRVDDQVKIHGYRIEPGEVVAALRRHLAVDGCTVRVENGRLVASIQPRAAIDPVALRAFLAGTLPPYAIPSRFETVAALPLTPTGKLDRSPLTVTEKVISKVWCDQLGVPHVNRDDDYFALGGDSIGVLDMFALLEAELPVLPRPTVIYRNSTLAALAAAIDATATPAIDAAAPGTDAPEIDAPEIDAPGIDAAPGADFPLTPSQRGFLLADAMGAPSTWLAAPRLHGPLDLPRFRRAVGMLVARHPMLRTVFDTEARPPTQRELADPGRLQVSYEPDPGPLADELATEKAHRFDPAAWPLLRLRLLRTGPGEHVLIMHAHHLIGDGFSVALLTRELFTLYDGGELPELRSDFRDYVRLIGGQSPEVIENEVANSSDVISTAGLTVPRRVPFLTVLNAYRSALTRVIGPLEPVIGVAVTGRDHPLPNLSRIFGPCAAAVAARPGNDLDRTRVAIAPHGWRYFLTHLDFDALGPLQGRDLRLTWDDTDAELTVPPGTEVLLATRPTAAGLRLTLRGRVTAGTLDTIAAELRSHLAPRAKPQLTLDAALIGYLPAPAHLAAAIPEDVRAILPSLDREGIRTALFPHGMARLLETVVTPLGRSGFICLPRFADELGHPGLASDTAAAIALAGAEGARTVSLAGMIPAHTGYGTLAARQTSAALITTGHAVTAASVVRTTLAALAAQNRDLSGCVVAVLGAGSIGTSSLRLLLDRAPQHPAALILCDLPSATDRLSTLTRSLTSPDTPGRTRFTGPVEIAAATPAAPDAVYRADLIIAASSGGPGTLDIDRLRPGTIVVDDSFPHCFDTGRALSRMRDRRDVLVVGGGLLDCGPTTREVAAGLPPIRFGIPGTLASCQLESLLHATIPGLPQVLGPVTPDHAAAYWNALDAAAVSAAPLHLLGTLVDPCRNEGKA
ncbi:non-ribosomal peptide synthetase/type I polyketide synthase [Actinoplanes sp. DH11]|uniref:non-ribosomal peptide synthetase/type I polyketide synthase n=1 Tax=Actinoplanes sp. DH11 TaxID=2857011 RepID=UPI0021072340|nr:non-ribosomal peptide synthetase/type I polyketide synthase [Actinoplanes sp. DH11]